MAGPTDRLEDDITALEKILDEGHRYPIQREFAVGNVVLLKSGGPAMTVIQIRKMGHIECVWFDDRECKHAVFTAPEIVKVAA